MFQQEFVLAVKSALGELLLGEGFIGRGLVWIRERSEFIDCVDIQLHSNGSTYCVNLGEHLKFLPIVGSQKPFDKDNASTTECEMKTRLAPTGTEDHWWEVRRVSSDVTEIANYFLSFGSTFFDQYTDFPKPFTKIKMEDIGVESTVRLMPLMTRIRRILLIARMYDYLNDSTNALAWATFGIEACGFAVGPKIAFREIIGKHKTR